MAFNNSHVNTTLVANETISATGENTKTSYNGSYSKDIHAKSKLDNTHIQATNVKSSERFTRVDGSVLARSSNTNATFVNARNFFETGFRRVHSFSERRDVKNRELRSILQRRAALQENTVDSKVTTETGRVTSSVTSDLHIYEERDTVEKQTLVSIDGGSFCPLRRTQSLRDRLRNRPNRMDGQEYGFSLSSILRDDLENLRGSSTDLSQGRFERRRLSDVSDDSHTQVEPAYQQHDIPPKLPPKSSRFQNRYNSLVDVPENMPVRSQGRRVSNVEVSRTNRIGTENWWSSSEDLGMGSTGNLSVSSLGSSIAMDRESGQRSDHASYSSRLNYAGKFREVLKESQRSMFESIGRELGPFRSSRHQVFERTSSHNVQQSSSMNDLSGEPNSTGRYDNNRRIDGVSDVREHSESRASRLAHRMGRSNSDVSTQSISDSFRSHIRTASRERLTASRDRLNAREDNDRVEQSTHVDDSTDAAEVYRPMRSERRAEVEVIPSQLETGKMKELLDVKTIRPRTPTGRRKLILDEQKLQELFLKCHVCGETYNSIDKLPKLLPCHHAFCLLCLSEIHKVERDHRKNMTAAYRAHLPTAVRLACPICRDAIIVTEDEIKKLPNDRTVLALLEVVEQSEACVVTYCSKHQTQPLNFFCETCVLPVCCDCTVLEHNQQENHVVRNIEEALKQYVPMIETTLDALDDHYNELVSQKALVEKSISDSNENKEEVTTKLKETFAHFRSAAQDRQEELVEIIQEEIAKKREQLGEYLRLVKERRRKLKHEQSRLISAQNDVNIVDLFTYNAELNKTLGETVNIPADCSDDMTMGLDFDEDEQKRVIEKLSEFGDVNFEYFDMRSSCRD